MKAVLFSHDETLATELGRILRGRWDEAWVDLKTESNATPSRFEGVALVFVDVRACPRDFARLIQEIRRVWSGPLVALSAPRFGTHAQVVALRAGADEVYELPPEPLLYLARIQALLRRTEATQRIRIGRLTILPETAEVYLDDQPLHLTRREYRLLLTLATRRGRVARVEDLIESVWEGESVDRATVRKYVQRLREKLGGDAGVEIVARPGIGYSLRPAGARSL